GVFFVQEEDGIRDWSVTGVQTCALPIYVVVGAYTADNETDYSGRAYVYDLASATPTVPVLTLHNPNPEGGFFGYASAISGTKVRSEERRVGKERRCRWGP